MAGFLKVGGSPVNRRGFMARLMLWWVIGKLIRDNLPMGEWIFRLVRRDMREAI